MTDGWPAITSGRKCRPTVVLFLVTMWILQNGCDCFPCGVPGKPVKGDFAPRAHRYNANEKVDYNCLLGHALVGERSSVCRSNGAWSNPPPLCMSNLAYQRRTEQSDGTNGQSDRAVDGYEDTCTPIGPDPSQNSKLPPKRWWAIHFAKPTTITNVNILLSKGSAYSLSLSIGKTAPPNGQSWTKVPKDQLQPFCHVQGATATDALKCTGHPVHGARFVIIEMSHHHNGLKIPFNLCEVQVFNQFDVHSTQSSHVATTDDNKESDPYFTTIIGIAVGATVASVSIVSAIVVVVCLMKRHLFKPVPTSEPPDNQHRGSSDLMDAGDPSRHRHLSTATTPTTTYRSSDSRYSLPETEYTTANSIATDHIYDYIKHQQPSYPLPPPPPAPLAAALCTASNGEISVDNDIYRSSSSSNDSLESLENGRKERNKNALASAQRRQLELDDTEASEEQRRPLVIGHNDYDTVCESPPPPLGPRDDVIQDGRRGLGRELQVFIEDPNERGDASTVVPETSL